MPFDTDWDIEKYRDENEPEEHWNLRKQFFLAYKSKYQEERLVCLAQVFYNVEFLGCRYPEKTMTLNAKLSKEIAADYRERKKGKLKRTFVAASDAAEAKIKRSLPCKTGFSKTENSTPKKFVASEDQFLKTTDPKLDSTAFNGSEDYLIKLNKIKNIKGPCGSMVVLSTPDESPISTLQKTASAWKMFNHYRTETTKIGTIWRSTAKFSDVVGIADSENMKASKAAANHLVVWKLQQHYYTVSFESGFSKKAIEGQALGLEKSTKGKGIVDDEPLNEDSKGSKMLRMMGWQGGGLGKDKQGIQEPIKAKGNTILSRAGFGCDGESQFNLMDVRRQLKSYIFRTDDLTNIVCSVEFTSDERKKIHKVAHELGLASKSVGKNEERQLIISKKVQLHKVPWLLVENILKFGDTSFGDYRLIPPRTTNAPPIAQGVTYHMDGVD